MFRILDAFSSLFAVLTSIHIMGEGLLNEGRIFMDCSTESFLNITDKQCSLLYSSSRHPQQNWGKCPMFGEVESGKAGNYPCVSGCEFVLDSGFVQKFQGTQRRRAKIQLSKARRKSLQVLMLHQRTD